MSKFDTLQDRATQLAGQIGKGLRHAPGHAQHLAGQIGDGIRHVPDHAQKWFKAGVAVGAARAGGRAMIRSTRRHPVISATTAATVMAVAAGLVVYAYRRRRETDEAIEGDSHRVESRRSARMRAPIEAHGGDEAA